MVANKTKKTTKKTPAKIESAPDLEKRRQDFKNLAANKKQKTTSSRSTKPNGQVVRRSRVVVTLIVLFILFVPVIAFAAYYSQYHSADRIVMDAFSNTLSAKSLSYTADISSPSRQLATITGENGNNAGKFDAKIQTSYPGQLATLDVGFVATSSDMYVNVPQASAVIAKNIPPSQKEFADAIVPIIKQDADGKWVRLQSNDASSLQNVLNMSVCAVESTRQIITQSQTRTQLADAYMQEPFLNTKMISSTDTTNTYQLTFDQKRFNEFLDNLTRSQADVPYSRCNKEIAALKQSDIASSVIEVTVDMSNRTLTHIALSRSGNNPQTITVTPRLNQPVSITEPKNAVEFNTIKTKVIGVSLLSQTIPGAN